MKRALCIWLPNWPLQRLAAARAELSGRAVVLYEQHPSRGARVVGYAAPLEAAATAPWDDDPTHTAGIRPGMPLAEATALADHTQNARDQSRGNARANSRVPCSRPVSMPSAPGKNPARATDLESESMLAKREHGTQQNSSQQSSIQQGNHSAAPGATAGLSSSANSHVASRHCWTSQQWHPAEDPAGVQGRKSRMESTAPLPLHLELHDPLTDRVALEELAEWCRHFSPTVGLEEGERPESLLLDVTGLAPLFGGEPALARRVAREFDERHLTAHVAIADTIGAAWALTHFPSPLVGEGGERSEPGKGAPSARSTTSPHPTTTPLIIPPNQAQRALAPLPIEALRLPEATCQLLAELGLRRIEHVAALPRPTLLSRFGPLLLERLDQAHGLAGEAIVARAAPEELEFPWLFEHPTGRREMIERVLDELVARACQTLARERRGLLRFECRFEQEGGAGSRFTVGLYRPSASPRHVGELVRLQFEAVRFRDPLSALHLTVLATDRLEFRQQEIFSLDQAPGERREAPRELAVLIDRLSNRLGAHAVARPWLLASALPEFACQYKPLAGLPTRRGKAASEPRPPIPGDRPLHLEPRPRPLSAVSIAPEGPPMQFRCAGREERIVQVWGPERIETRWWRTRCVRRDYYQVETFGGQRFWLFRHLNTGKWFLQGEFV